MNQKITVPDIGDYQDVEIIEVSVQKGDSIKQEDVLLVLETDKATMEVPASVEGSVSEVLVKVGDRVSQGTPIFNIDSAAAVTHAPADAANASAEAAPAASEAANNQPSRGALIEVPLPDIGDYEGVDVIELLVQPGDQIEVDQPILMLETDKATMEIPSPQAGVIQNLHIEVGSKVSAGDLIMSIASQANDNTAKPASTAEPVTPAAPTAPTASPAPVSIPPATNPPSSNASVYASPAVRRLASKADIDLSLIKGTGRKGRITQDDLALYLKQQSTTVASDSALNIAPIPEVDYSKYGPVQIQPLNRVKQLTAQAMHRNWVTIPHITLFDETDIVELEAFRKSQKEFALAQGIKLTPLAFIVKALAKVLREFPAVNASLNKDGQSLTVKDYMHIGFAVDTPMGLMVPVIKNANQKGVLEIAKDIIDLSSKARDGKLAGSDMQGGSFTVSSLGNLGTQYFTPIINAPEVGILGVSKAYQKPVYLDGQFIPRLFLPLSLSLDHRVIDGAEGARFLSRLMAVLTDIRQQIL